MGMSFRKVISMALLMLALTSAMLVFRNRGDTDVTVTLRTGGQYNELRNLT